MGAESLGEESSSGVKVVSVEARLQLGEGLAEVREAGQVLGGVREAGEGLVVGGFPSRSGREEDTDTTEGFLHFSSEGKSSRGNSSAAGNSSRDRAGSSISCFRLKLFPFTCR